jgi:hypothetical protein
MKLRLATACALATLTMAGAAFADTRVNLTLETPKPAKTKLIAAHAVFVCENATCVAGVAPDDSITVSTCKEVVRKVGRVSAYGSEYKALSAEQLASCNAAAPAPATTQAAN